MYVDGGFVDARSGATYALPNPATEEVVGHAPDANVEDMRRAIAAARRAFEEPRWRAARPSDRARILDRIADGIERRKDAFRTLLVAAHGAEAMTLGVQLEDPIAHLRKVAELARHHDPDELLEVGNRPTAAGMRVVQSLAHRQPVGVCGLIPTWNFPLYVTVQKLGPALATGCTMVIKPSPLGPLCDLLLAEVLAECDLPPGVVNVVTGQSDALGVELTESEAIDKISFTGSAATGKRIARAAAGTLKRIHLELGGKSAALVLPDAPLDEVAPTLAAPAFFHAGQGCALATRVLVPRALHDGLVERMLAFLAGFVRIGDPADPEVTLGPLIRDERRRAVEALIVAGKEEGAVVATGGRRPAGLARGYFLEPTVLVGVDNAMRVAREEIFGPVVCVLPYADEDDAVRIANDSRYGLGGMIMTRDTGKAIALAKRIRTGGVSINGANNHIATPFGGFKESGLGREGGRFGLEEYTELQRISWPA
jgi:acyl-CoA reductase-like NAD-dependent aldehyde dehydrogenase